MAYNKSKAITLTPKHKEAKQKFNQIKNNLQTITPFQLTIRFSKANTQIIAKSTVIINSCCSGSSLMPILLKAITIDTVHIPNSKNGIIRIIINTQEKFILKFFYFATCISIFYKLIIHSINTQK